MPITFSVTCDTDEELARFLENLTFAQESLAQMKPIAGKKAEMAAIVPPTTAPEKATKAGKTPKVAKNKKAVAKSGNKPGRKPSQLGPVIQNAIAETVKRGKPFKSRDVIELVMKKAPELKESSVTTGVSKLLSESSLKWEKIQDSVGRPYKLYKP